MPVHQYQRQSGQRLTYEIDYDHGEYFIRRDGQIKKAFPDALAAAMAPSEATPDLMLRMAIMDIEALTGMDE